MPDDFDEQPLPVEAVPLPEPLPEPEPAEEEETDDMSDLFEVSSDPDIADVVNVSEEDVMGDIDEDGDGYFDDLLEVDDDLFDPGVQSLEPEPEKPRYRITKPVAPRIRREPPPTSLGGIRS